MEKRCLRCKESLPVENFYKNRAQKDGINYYCKSCCSDIRREREGSVARGPHSPSSNISVLEFAELVLKQGGKCALCGEEPVRACVDHDHKTGRIRGVLCYSCNGRLSRIDAEKDWLARALKYIKG